MRNKKATELLLENLIFILLIVVFFLALFFFINRASNQASISEQIYAKQISLMINKARSGTNITLDISNLYDISKENNLNGMPVVIDNENNEVRVTLSKGQGYSYPYFTSSDVLWNLQNGKLEMRFV